MLGFHRDRTGTGGVIAGLGWVLASVAYRGWRWGDDFGDHIFRYLEFRPFLLHHTQQINYRFRNTFHFGSYKRILKSSDEE